ncbi:type II toxin-antitoxin system RatA family toxin [Rhodoligotrophos defluvii]|uniref:type II toxin-antitoxin system RatA family toxin n=1 Tax=Rhodoligotrophos defluvii TaxID=2561934 RepID=UPI0010C9CA93|nr:type II toxin-antitoxin system RatA family toxin [Rhodoligotrophos defluvii]
MRDFKTSYRMPYSADQMFALAADIGSYPEFVPLCEKAVIHSRAPLADGREALKASLVVGYEKLHLNETFVSDVTLDPARGHIQSISNTGPVKQLQADWHFVPLSESASRIDFNLTYQMRSFTLQMLMSVMFDKAFQRIVHAFRDRADHIYGNTLKAQVARI